MRVLAVAQGSLVLAAVVVTAWAALRAPTLKPSAPRAPGGVALDSGRPSAKREETAEPGATVALYASPSPSPPSDPSTAMARDGAALPPDLTQSDPELDLPGGGAAYCAPVSVSNSLMWLAARGYDRLAPEGATIKSRQVALVQALVTTKYMGTSPANGTGPAGVLRGLSQWVRHAGYRIARLQYQGWRGHPRRFDTGVTHPNLAWLAEALEARGAAWLHVGWYHRDRYQPGLRRRGGHWLTLVGVQQSDGEPTIAARDPAPYAGDTPTVEHVTLRKLEQGTLVDGLAALPAKGYYALTSGIQLKRPDDVPVIDGAVILVLEAPP
jgi:hypothetical protein